MILRQPNNSRIELQRLRRLYHRPRVRPPLKLRNAALFLLAVFAAGLGVYALWDGPLPREAVYMAGIFILAALLWVFRPLLEGWLPGLTDTADPRSSR